MANGSLQRRRDFALGSGAELFYDEPLEIVRGEGVYLFDSDGRRYVDMYNNVPVVGHANPAVVRAMAEQQATVNVHSRYLHEGIVAFAERFTRLNHEGIESVVAKVNEGEGSVGRLQLTSELSMGDPADFVAEFACAVPYPFEGILDVGEPTITGVSPAKVPQGQKFTITGAELYPGLVSAVLLGGTSVGDTNFTANGETSPGSGIFTIDVIVPGTQPAGNSTVVAQQTFNSQARFSNDDITVDVERQN